MLPKFNKNRREKEEEFWQHCYRNSSAQIPARPVKKKQLRQYQCRNRKKEIFFLVIVAMALPRMGKKLNEIMAMSLPKMGEKKNLLPKSGKKF